MRIFKKYIFLLVVILLSMGNVKALSVSKNKIDIVKGETSYIDISTKVSEDVSSISFNLVYTSYDVPANFVVNDSFKKKLNGTRYTVFLEENSKDNVVLGKIKITPKLNPKGRSGNINITNVKALYDDGTKKDLSSQFISVNIIDSKIEEHAEKPKEEKVTRALKEIKSSIVTIPLEDNKNSYDIYISKDIKTLDLIPVTIDESYEVSVSNQNLKEGNNVINITISKDDYKEEYNINVFMKDEVIKNNNDKNNYKSKWIVLVSIFGVSFLILLLILKKFKF